MKSALFLVLFPMFALGVFGDEVSVKEGGSVTLQTGVEIQSSDEIEWRLKENLIFRISSSAGKISVLDNTKGAFGGRLKVEEKNGDLKITDIKTTDAGEYKLQITSTRGSSEKIFNVNVDPGLSPVDPGLSPGAITGIVFAVVGALAAAVGGIYYGYVKKGTMFSTV